MIDLPKEDMIQELICLEQCDKFVEKDILIVVKDQKDLLKKCIDSIFVWTSNFTLYLWDNGSRPETAIYMRHLSDTYENVHLIRVSENQGFIIPNNRLAELGRSPYIILLNSDTEVQDGWDRALIGYLQTHPKVGIIGYEGGMLSDRGMGILPALGDEVDYVMGWCLCLPRTVYEQFGLFDEKNLRFAYCEDADLCLRVREQGLTVHALSVSFVIHHANQTARVVKKERDFTPDFLHNHTYMETRWGNYLKENRKLLRFPDVEKAIMLKKRYTPEQVAHDFKNS